MSNIKLDKLAGPKGGSESYRYARFWMDQIEKMGKDKKYMQYLKRGQKIEARYRDERTRNDEDERRKYNSLWSNVEILRPAVYGRIPTPVAERKFNDKDPIARGAAQILERALRNEIEINNFHDAMNQAVSDYLLPGRGTLWVRYEPEFESGVSLDGEDSIEMKDNLGQLDEPSTGEDIQDREDDNNEGGEKNSEEEGEESDTESEDTDTPEEDKLESTGDRIIRESAPVDYVSWDDFLVFPVNARTWMEVVAVGKRVYMTYTQMKERFGKEIAKKIPLEKDERMKFRYENTTIEHEVKGEVFEIWNKEDRFVYWVAEGYDYLLDRKEDPLTLENFFPTPRPIIANQTNNTLIPVADYIEYQDQATQIDELSQRIAMLTRACKVAGVYDSANRGVRRLLDESVENELIPVDSWAAFAEKGGLAGVVSFLPLKEIIGVLNELVTLKGKQIEEMDRLTGINDLMRGTSDARETLGGVRLKSNYTGTRLTARQNEVARFARDTVRIIADVMCQHFSIQSLVEASGAMYEEGLGVDVASVQMSMQAMQQAPAQPSMQPPQSAALPALQPQGGNVIPFPGNAAPAPQAAPPVAPGLPMPPPPDPMQIAIQQASQRIQAAIGLLRDEKLRGFRVDIEVDSTIYADAMQEKQDRNEFIGAITKYLETSMQLAAQIPEMTPLLGKLLQFGVRGYRVGRDLEATIEEFCDQATKLAKQKQQEAKNAPNPEMVKAQAQAAQAKATSQAAQVRAQADVAKSHGDIQASLIQAQADKQKASAEVQRQAVENQGEQANAQADMAMKQMDMRMRMLELSIEQMRAHSQADQMHRQLTQPDQMQGGLGNGGGPPQGNMGRHS